MLKAVLFDDEFIVVKGLRESIDWAGFGIELAGTAGDGVSALALFRSVRPDLLLTDIRMPGMDGLQLIEAVLREAPETYCIVFSGFNEFDYVRQAIQLGVADYLEKPITIRAMENAIRKALGKIGAQRETLAIRRKWEDSRRELLEKATLDLLLLGADAEWKWREHFGAQADHVAAVTVFAGSGDFRVPDRPEYETVAVRSGEERLAAVFHFIPPSHDFRDMLAQEAEHAELAVGGGRSYSDPAQARASCLEAKKALRSALFLNMKGLVRFKELGAKLTAPSGLPEREEDIILCMRAGDYAGLMERIDRFIAWIRAEKIDPEVAEREMVKLLYLALEAAREGGAAALPDSFVPHVEIREMLAKGKMPEWFREQMERIADRSRESRRTSGIASVERARSFIERNLSRDLSLEEVAEHVGMNASYLSVLFKEAVGESYIKYVTRIRIERAKKLLSAGMKVNDVSERVGYRAYRHFSEVFKRVTGFTPGQYREEKGAPK